MRQTSEKDERVKVFLRNFLPLSGLDCLLREILNSATCLNTNLQERNVNSSEDAFGLRRVCDPRCLVGQGLLLVILDSNSLTTACQWLAEIQDSQLEAPVIAVTEKIEPDQIQTLLDC